ncbi:MAG: CPBP family intramembrane metalloprotease [Chloroflexi bacterium]|nr:CPBP family intramembrane metalloprotease [Chloroflexota bacterium]
MLETILVALIVMPLIIVANREEARGRRSVLLALLTFDLVRINGLWRSFATGVKRMNFAEAPAFDPAKPVHRTAALLMALGFLMIATLYLSSDIADDNTIPVDAQAGAVLELIGGGALHLGAAFLGVGWLTRRRLPDVVRRLGLRMPTLWEAAISIGVGVGLWTFSTAAVALWERAVPADIFQQQTAEAQRFYEAFSGSLALALLLALLPALSEEIFYRGALQPVFGILLSSLFFTATHLQYAFTPALLILFAVSLGFAWLRLRFHTGAAIIAHALFNFMPYLAGA